jgi:AcrR family transcriptional regulator
MTETLDQELARISDLSHEARRLSFVRETFQREAVRMGRRNGLIVVVDDRRLTRAFVRWRERFEALKHHAERDRRSFIRQAAAMMAEELLRQKAVTARPFPSAVTGRTLPADPVVQFWPEGAIVMDYCLAVAIAMLRHDGEEILESPKAKDLRIWWSFRETAGEDVAITRPFFDMFLGKSADWLGEAARLPEESSGSKQSLQEG